MRALLAALIAAASTACASPRAQTASAPEPPRSTPPPEAAAPAIDPMIYRERPHEDAPANLRHYGRLAGTWRCQAFEAQKDGSWQPKAWSTWTFFYALGGTAIQDVWVPDGGGPVGTNLRLYDAESDTWTMVWASARQPLFDTFTAVADDQRIVMHGERRERSIFKAHRARITFHDLKPDRFSWRYEATAPGADGPWQPIQRIECRRAAG